MSKTSRRNRALARGQQRQVQPQLPRAVNGVPMVQAGSPPNSATAIAASFYSGPIPPPELLESYDRLVPGTAAQILARVEKQSDHRMQLEKLAVKSDVNRANRGLIAAFVLSLAFLVAGARLVHEGHDTAGAAIVGIDIAGLAGAFIYGTSQRKKEREKKAAVQAQLARR